MDTEELILIEVLAQVEILMCVISKWQPVDVDEQCNLEVLLQCMHHQDILLQQSAQQPHILMFSFRASKHPLVSFIDQVVELQPA